MVFPLSFLLDWRYLMLKYLLGQLTQMTSWIGIVLIICALIAPRWAIIVLGVILFITHDEALKGWVTKNAPGITDWINKTIASWDL